MAQQLRTCVSLVDGLGLILNTHMVIHNHLQFYFILQFILFYITIVHCQSIKTMGFRDHHIYMQRPGLPQSYHGTSGNDFLPLYPTVPVDVLKKLYLFSAVLLCRLHRETIVLMCEELLPVCSLRS